MMRRVVIPILMILALLACERKERFSAKSVAATDEAGRVAATLPAATPQQQPQQPAQPRMIIRTANVSMIVDDTAGSIEKMTAAAEAVGGYVSDSKVWRDGEQLRGNVTLRIPADRLSAALAVIRTLAVRIQSESIGSQEVTQESIDLQSQLRNLEAAETELRQLMTTIRQNSKRASEVLEMYQQLSTIRSQIEQTKGRMRYLGQMTALATVQVDLIPNALAKPVVEAGWQPLVIVRNASRALVGALQSFAGIVIWLVIYILPVLMIVGAIALAMWRGITLVWQTRKSPNS
jgi:cell division protein FtsB